MNTEKYIKGFNHRYIIKKYNPELYNRIVQTTENDYIHGIKDGGYELD